MDTLNSLLLSEFFIATGYFDRLVFALTEMGEFQFTPTGRDLFANVINQYNQFFVERVDLEFNINEAPEFKIGTFKKNIKKYQAYIEKLTSLPFGSNKKREIIIQFINLTYDLSHELHNYALTFSHFDIQYPRMSLIKEVYLAKANEDLHTSKKFTIDPSDIQEIINNHHDKTVVDFIELKRDEKYDHFVHAGHLNISEKNYDKAIDNFYKAKNYKDTAEVFTLLAWAFSFKDNLEKAKSYCLKAIAKDAQYGPAYNDFGNYLLSEGNVKESFKWFELAKRALNYQNREYPYINMGRAYMLEQKYSEALKEFSTALILAPYHEELHDTVKKLRMGLERNNEFVNPILNNKATEYFHETT